MFRSMKEPKTLKTLNIFILFLQLSLRVENAYIGMYVSIAQVLYI